MALKKTVYQGTLLNLLEGPLNVYLGMGCRVSLCHIGQLGELAVAQLQHLLLDFIHSVSCNSDNFVMGSYIRSIPHLAEVAIGQMK